MGSAPPPVAWAAPDSAAYSTSAPRASEAEGAASGQTVHTHVATVTDKHPRAIAFLNFCSLRGLGILLRKHKKTDNQTCHRWNADPTGMREACTGHAQACARHARGMREEACSRHARGMCEACTRHPRGIHEACANQVGGLGGCTQPTADRDSFERPH